MVLQDAPLAPVPTRPVSGSAARRRRAVRRRRVVAVVLAPVLLLSLLAGWSIGASTSDSSGDGFSAQLAEWARDHGLGAVVTGLESLQYRLNPPVTGGTPDTSVLAAAAHEVVGSGRPTAAGARRSASPAGVSLPVLARVAAPVSPALPGEGVFVPAAGSAGLVQVAYVRPDTVHTSYLTGVVWLSRHDRFVLHPGYQDPGASSAWSQASRVTQLDGLLATFNGGFKLVDANGGYADHGHVAGTLTDGAASLVMFKDGHATVGTWGVDVRMTPDVAFVRQNLQPLITHGRAVANLDSNVQSTWGATLGGAYAVWRSGIGVTRTGDLVYAMGDALTVQALASVLQRAGAVTAMQLDINRAWVSFMTYTHSHGSVIAHKVGTFERPAARYLTDTSRDFVAVYAP